MANNPLIDFPAQGSTPYVRTPTKPIRWPAPPSAPSHTQTQLQQIKAAGLSARPDVITPAPSLASPGTQGLPATLSNVRISRKEIDSGHYQLSVAFDHHPGDPYYRSAKVHLAQGNGDPVAVAEGERSPIKFIVPKTPQSTTVYVQSTGNWGSSPVKTSPSRTVSVR